MTLFRRNNDVVIALCVRWDRTTLPLRPRLHYIKHTVHWLYCSGCWFHLGSAYLHINKQLPVSQISLLYKTWGIATNLTLRNHWVYVTDVSKYHSVGIWSMGYWCAILIAHQIVMAKHGGSCVHFSGISTCGRTSRETVSHSQHQPLPTPHKIALPVYVTVTNKRLQPLTTTLYNSLVLSFSLLTTKRRLIKHRSFLRVLRSS